MIGIDEVGRGAWAGPLLVVAARSVHNLPAGITDSKALSNLQRQHFSRELLGTCEFGEGWVEPAEIDQFGLSTSLTIGASRALASISVSRSEHIILDGKFNYIPIEYEFVETRVKADSSVPIVSAASIWAKVARDAYMEQLSTTYPEYGFERHVGYGTRLHSNALRKHGPLAAVHRFCFKPIRELV